MPYALIGGLSVEFWVWKYRSGWHIEVGQGKWPNRVGASRFCGDLDGKSSVVVQMTAKFESFRWLWIAKVVEVGFANPPSQASVLSVSPPGLSRSNASHICTHHSFGRSKAK